jgi:hypothetical protein
MFWYVAARKIWQPFCPTGNPSFPATVHHLVVHTSAGAIQQNRFTCNLKKIVLYKNAAL